MPPLYVEGGGEEVYIPLAHISYSPSRVPSACRSWVFSVVFRERWILSNVRFRTFFCVWQGGMFLNRGRGGGVYMCG